MKRNRTTRAMCFIKGECFEGLVGGEVSKCMFIAVGLFRLSVQFLAELLQLTLVE